jgi:hypothetical protein
LKELNLYERRKIEMESNKIEAEEMEIKVKKGEFYYLISPHCKVNHVIKIAYVPKKEGKKLAGSNNNPPPQYQGEVLDCRTGEIKYDILICGCYIGAKVSSLELEKIKGMIIKRVTSFF